MKKSRPHDEAVIDMLKNDPDFANEYLAVALEEADQPGGQQALLSALRHIVKRKACLLSLNVQGCLVRACIEH